MQDFLDYINVLGEGSGRKNASVAALAIITGLFGTLSILLINLIIGRGFQADLLLIIAFLAASGLSIFTRRMAMRKMRAFLEDRITQLRLDLVFGIRDMDFPSIERLDQIEAVTRMTIDARRISRTADVIVRAYYGFFIFVFVAVYLGWLSPLALGLFVGLFAIGALSSRLYERYIAEPIGQAATEEERMFQAVEHLVSGFKTLKLDRARRDDFFENNLFPLVGRIRDLRKEALNRIGENQSIQRALLLSFVGFFFLLNNDATVSAQVMITFLFLRQSAMDVIVSLPFFTEAGMAARRIEGLQKAVDGRPRQARRQPQHAGPESSGTSEPPPAFQLLEVRDIRFDYTDEQGQSTYSFGPARFEIKRNEITFIIGGNGSGKTTFLKLLLGLYLPLSGSFAADGEKIAMQERCHWFSAIFSDFHLFNGLYGVETVDEGKLARLLHEMGLSSRTAWQGDRFSNTELSTGQKKRLALAVALMEDKPIYVFDEWAAEQDAPFRARFYEEILPDLKAMGKTVIVVSHDDRYFHCADHVIGLDYGKVSQDSRLSLSSKGSSGGSNLGHVIL